MNPKRVAHYRPDPRCAHNRQRPSLQAGWTWGTDQDGDRTMVRCNCWLAHNGKPPHPENQPAYDAKAAAAGVSA